MGGGISKKTDQTGDQHKKIFKKSKREIIIIIIHTVDMELSPRSYLKKTEFSVDDDDGKRVCDSLEGGAKNYLRSPPHQRSHPPPLGVGGRQR